MTPLEYAWQIINEPERGTTMQTDEYYAAHLLSLINSPIADKFVPQAEQWSCAWGEVYRRYHLLSGGEQAVVDLACHVTGRGHCLGKGYESLWHTVGKMDGAHRKEAAELVFEWMSTRGGAS